MTIQELLQSEPYLTPDEAKTGIYLIPCGKKGYTSFPVGKIAPVEVTKKRVLPEGYIFPEGITAQERSIIENETIVEQKFILDKQAVLISPDDYQNLQIGTHVWSNSKIVAYTKPQNVLDAEALLEKSRTTSIKREEAHKWLASNDYIGNKVAQVQLFGSPEDISAIKQEYTGKYIEAKAQRKIINDCDTWAKDNALALTMAQETIEKENR